MTDVNGMTFANLSLSSNIRVAGETLTASITVKNGSSVNIPVFNLRMVCSKADFTGNEDDRIFTFSVFSFTSNDVLPKGKIAVYTKTWYIDSDAAEYFALYPDVRAVPVYIEYDAYNTAIGNFSRSDYKIDDLVIINARYQPKVEEFEMQRCISGALSDEGQDVLSTLKLYLNPDSDISTMKLHLHYDGDSEATTDSAYIDLTSEIPRLLTGVTNSTDLIIRQFSNGSNWDFLLFFGDEYESATAKQSLARAFANLHLSGAKTGGACFGGFSSSSEGDPKLESYYPGHFYSGIHGVNIFSYQEVKTGGRWADNKPLYTKVVAITDAVSGVVQNADMPADVESIWIDTSASFCITSSGVVYPLSYPAGNGASVFLANCNLSQRKIFAAANAGGTADLYIKIFYTKTTDEAIAPVQTHAQLIDADDAAMVEKSGLSFYAEEYDNTVYKSTYTGRQIDAGIANALNALLVTGGTMTGPLILSGNPAEPLGAVTKQYLETKLGEIALTPGPPGVGIIDITIEEVV